MLRPFSPESKKDSKDDAPTVSLRLSRFPRTMGRDNEMMLSPLIQFSTSEETEYKVSSAVASTPTVWIFLIDISGSMGDHNKLVTVKALLTEILSTALIKEKDTIELITFNTEAKSIYRGAKIGKAGMAELVKPLKAEGGTTFVKPFEIINPAHYNKKHKVTVIGLTDGLPSVESEIDGTEIRRQFNEKFSKAGYSENAQIIFMGVGDDCDVAKIQKFHQPVVIPVHAKDAGAMMKAFMEALAEKDKDYVEIEWAVKNSVKIRSAPLGHAEAKGLFLGAPFIIDTDEFKDSMAVEYWIKVKGHSISSGGVLPSSLQAIPIDYQVTYSYLNQQLLRIQDFEYKEYGLVRPLSKKNSLEALKAEISAIMDEGEDAPEFKQFNPQFGDLLEQIQTTLKGFSGDQASLNQSRLATTKNGRIIVTTEYDQSMLSGKLVPITTEPRATHLGKDKVSYKVSNWSCPWSDKAASNLVQLTDRPMVFPHPDPSYKNRVLILINPSELKQYREIEFKSAAEIVDYVKRQVPIETTGDPAEPKLKNLCVVSQAQGRDVYVIPSEIPLGAFVEKNQGDAFIQALWCYYLLSVNIKERRIPKGSLEFHQARTDKIPSLVSRFFISYRINESLLCLIDPGNDKEHQLVNLEEEKQQRELISYYETTHHLLGILRNNALPMTRCNNHPGFVNFPSTLFDASDAGLDFYRRTVGIPDYLLCPLSGLIMQSPVFFKENNQYAFDRASAEKWLAQCNGKLRHPITKKPISGALVPANRIIVRMKNILQALPYYRLSRDDIDVVTQEMNRVLEGNFPRKSFTIKTEEELERMLKEQEKSFYAEMRLSTLVPFVLKTVQGLLMQPATPSVSYPSSSSSCTSSSSSSIGPSMSSLPSTAGSRTMTYEEARELSELREQVLLLGARVRAEEKEVSSTSAGSHASSSTAYSASPSLSLSSSASSSVRATTPMPSLGPGTEHLPSLTVFSQQQSQIAEATPRGKVHTKEHYKDALKKAHEDRVSKTMGKR